ncbi:MAG TPA: LptE family protein [Chitinivibrionales bacterium]|nr:LptE family protein [Chitinivibrionales bacterium]
MKRFSFSAAVLCALWGCGVYTFSGSTLPAHLKTMDIPLFANQSLIPGVAEDITNQLSAQVVSMNLLRISSGRGDATLRGKVVEYTNAPRTYGTTAVRQVTVSEYVVRITVEVEFVDNKSNSPLYKGRLTGEGVYNFQTQAEADGRKTAESDVVQQILQNSVQSW